MYDEIKTVPLKRTFGRLRLPEMTHQSGAAAVAVECVCVRMPSDKDILPL